MGRVAAGIADLVIVTSDNPRDEDPETIINEVLAGTAGGRARILSSIDRREAIREAIHRADVGDIVVIAGKGHEITQEIAGVHSPFDDVRVASELLQPTQGVTQ